MNKPLLRGLRIGTIIGGLIQLFFYFFTDHSNLCVSSEVILCGAIVFFACSIIFHGIIETL